MKVAKRKLKQIIKEELGSVLKEFDQPDSDYLDSYNYRQKYGVPNPKWAAEKESGAAARAAAEEIDNEVRRILNDNPEAKELYNQIQDAGWSNNYEVDETKLQQFLEFFQEGPIRQLAKKMVTYFH